MKKRIYTTMNHMNEKVAVVFQYSSTNSKTGNAVQIAVVPFDWITEGKSAMDKDTAVCFDCPHSQLKNASCYVRKGHSNMGMKSKVDSLHNAFLNGTLEIFDIEHAPVMEKNNLKNQFVRFGQYGEPVLLGEKAVSAIAQLSSNWTGYTHLWFLPQYAWSAKYFMASVETQPLAEKAQTKGFRTFRVRSESETIQREVTCPASKEGGRKVTCNTCGLCKGNETGAKSVVIIKH